jgi:1,4-alpha-glucan branching enzyme
MARAKTTNRKVAFTLVAPEAQSVHLAGDFTAWDAGRIELKKQKDGVWKKLVDLPPGRHEYRYLVDGQWQNDPNCPERVWNSFGSQNCVRLVE